ncbi:MAG TPA: LamG-like jellyroll fold domain-containing protein, partial [Polyangiaceae bacterium]|nr:LamG-like jellyroll fold domain-containing protein [Polyangiaceae bacterium]
MTTICVPTAHNNSDIASVGLWQFDGNLNDSSGGGNNLSVSTGTARYTDLFSGVDTTNGGGLRGLLLDGSTVVGLSSSNGTFQITGNLTIEFIITLGMPPGSNIYLFSHGASGESAATNYLYSLRVLPTNQLSYFAEHSSGTDIQFDSDACLCPGEPTHVAMVRSSAQISLYLNGILVGAASS